MEVINRKTQNRYYVDDVVIDSTNELEPEKQVKILYSNDKAERFVREAHEFIEKFYIPHGFNILSKACELAMQDVKKFHNRVESVSNIQHSKIEDGKLTWENVEECDWDNSCHKCGNCYLEPDSCHEYDCSCEDHECQCEKEYIGEMIDVDVYKTYRQQKESCWYVPEYIVKEKAYKQLKELFNRRCSTFEIVKKEYDNATNDYFLVGYRNEEDFPKNPIQVCKIPYEVFNKIYNCVEGELVND